MKNRSTRLAAALGAFCISGVAFASTTPEVEPNGLKSEATPVPLMVAGDDITGTSTGTSVTAMNSAVTSADTFDITTASLPLGIYKHTLTLTTTGTAGHTMTIRGLNQTGTRPAAGVAGTLDTLVSSSLVSGVTRVISWYGFGKSERLYLRVAGTASTTAPYDIVLTTSAVTPTDTSMFHSGTITVTTVGQGHTTDTELWIYDATLSPISGAGSDDITGGIAGPSMITGPYTAGVYYIALTNYNFASNQTSPAGDAWVNGPLMDFADSAANSSPTSPVNCAFAITDSAATYPFPATKGSAFEILWLKMCVYDGPSPSFAYCFGDGLDPMVTTPCPCGNVGAAGHGCANSVDMTGALLAASGTTNPDTMVLAASGMPATVTAIYLKGASNIAAGALFGDGVRCAGSALIRLGQEVNVGGSSSYPTGVQLPISVRGNTPPGSCTTGYYQTYYRNAAAAFCPPETFNVTNGWTITW